MTVAVEHQKSDKKEEAIDVPDYLIYEMDEGKPIYYRGYKDVLNKTKTLEQIMGSSSMHALIIYLIQKKLMETLGDQYVFLTGEMGYQWAPKSWRNLDIAIYDKREMKDKKAFFKTTHIDIAPETVIEIDTKAELRFEDYPDSYFQKKTDQLLANGVEKVIWLFTHTRKYLIAESGKNWVMNNWSESFEVKNGIELNIEQLIEEF